jgi:hypothetical protein
MPKRIPIRSAIIVTANSLLQIVLEEGAHEPEQKLTQRLEREDG